MIVCQIVEKGRGVTLFTNMLGFMGLSWRYVCVLAVAAKEFPQVAAMVKLMMYLCNNEIRNFTLISI